MTNHRKFYTFNFPGSLPGSKTLLTGIRQTECKDQYLITGFYELPDSAELPPVSFVFKGDLCQHGKWYILNYPSTEENVVTATNLYGPSVDKCSDKIKVVGNYTLQNQESTIGCLYEGCLNGKGEWLTIVPTPLSTDPILNTICHSTMGQLVVGNYNITDQGKAFIYDIKCQTYTDIVYPDALSITAYGIWYNGCGKYTIAGGLFTAPGAESGYLVDWDNKKKKFCNWALFNYCNDPVKSVVTHFDGISGTGEGDSCSYTLTGDYVQVDVNDGKPQAFFAKVKRDNCGKFCKKAKWETLKFKDATGISGNSVSGCVVIGVYNGTDDTTVNGYVSY